ncbi:MAG: rod shape-determining protein MreC [Patescibacteria group bacterium]|nr:rod shape-determining protein MreC [Patescibacteria group bacterium]
MKKTKLALIILVLLIILASPLKKAINKFVIEKTSGVTRSFSIASIKTKSLFTAFFEISKLKKQNEDLSQKIMSLDVDKSKISELEYENSLLKKELGYIENDKEHSFIPSRIIGREPTNFLDYIIVDKGEKDGVVKDSAVISGGALVGQVKEVYENQSKITLITSKDSIILAMLQNSRSKGILRGGISGLVLEDITREADYQPGDYIVTSGLDGQLKEGILIGKADNLQSSSSELFKNISVEPTADLSKLELVFISK